VLSEHSLVVCMPSGDREMKQLDMDQTTTSTSEDQMSADYLLLHTAFKAGEQQRRRQTSNTLTASDADRRQSVPRVCVDDDALDPAHRRTHSLKCPSSSSSPAARRQSAGTCRRAGSVKSTPPRSVRNVTNASPKVLTAISTLCRENHVVPVVISSICLVINLLPPIKEELHVFARVCLFVCLSVCLLARLLKNACVDLDEMLRVDRCRDMDELINF